MKALVRDQHANPLLCCWDDCGQWGDDRHAVIYGPNKVRYIFCCEGHAAYWRHSHISQGNRASGDRSVAGIIVR